MKSRTYNLTDPEDRKAVQAYLDSHPEAYVSLQFHSTPYPEYRSSEVFFAPQTPEASCEPTGMVKACLSMLFYAEGATLALRCNSFDVSTNAVLTDIFSSPNYTFIGYHLAIDLCWLSHLKLPIPEHVWDVRIAQRLNTLGRVNIRARAARISNLSQQID